VKIKIFLSIMIVGLVLSSYSQKPSLELSFTAIDSVSYVQSDSIRIMNRTQGSDTILHWPDTVLVLDYNVGIQEGNIVDNFRIFQNYPNPVSVCAA